MFSEEFEDEVDWPFNPDDFDPSMFGVEDDSVLSEVHNTVPNTAVPPVPNAIPPDGPNQVPPGVPNAVPNTTATPVPNQVTNAVPNAVPNQANQVPNVVPNQVANTAANQVPNAPANTAQPIATPLTPEQAQDLETAKSLLSEFLEDKDDIFKTKVLNIVVKHGLPSSDPLFLLLFATSTLQVMLEEAPSALHLSVEKARQTQAQIAVEATQQTKTEIAKATRELINKTEALQLSRPSKVLIPGLSLFTIVFGLGLLSGIAATVSFNQLASSGKVLSVSEAATLEWANGAEGKYAKNLWEWNKPYLQSGNCINDMQQLGVRLTFGTKTAVSGICALWVVPPNERKYQQQ